MIKNMILKLHVFILLLMICSINICCGYKAKSSNLQTENKTLYTEADSITEISKNTRPFAEKYNLNLYFTEFKASDYAKRWAKWTTPDNDDIDKLNRYMKLFTGEWSKYPVEWVKKSNLKGIAFVKTLMVNGQQRYAMPDAYGETLYYDITYNSTDEIYERSSLHHEYYHMIEENYFGDMYYKDEIWASFNPPGFKYKSSGYDAYNDTDYTSKDHPTKGFVTYYSLYGLEEDKAETYSYIMTTEKYHQIIEWTKEDDILAKKVEYMKSFIEKHCSEMNDEYWNNIHNK